MKILILLLVIMALLDMEDVLKIKYRVGKGNFRNIEEGFEREWLMGNGLGGFSNMSVTGNMARIHAGYLVASLNPPVDRIKILAKTDESVKLGDEVFDFSCQMYEKKDNTCGYKLLEAFEFDGVPTYYYRANDFRMTKSIALEYGSNTVAVCYKVRTGNESAWIKVTPLFSGRDNNLAYEKKEDVCLCSDVNGKILSVKNENDDRFVINTYVSDGEFVIRDDSKDSPVIIDDLKYSIDIRNGFDGTDYLYASYDIMVNVPKETTCSFYIICSADVIDDNGNVISNVASKDGFKIVEAVRKRALELEKGVKVQDEFAAKLALAADPFIVDRKSTGLKTILAGFPWFTDWGRDTMIALTGLTLCTGRIKDNEEILESFSKYEKDGLIPNMFPSYAKEEPIYNTVDASLWYFYAVYKYLEYTGKEENYEFIHDKIYGVLCSIIENYKKGTLFSIGMDEDGLIHAGSDYDQVTWMDVRVGEWVVTPRHGKPVEINALWYNALKVMEMLAKKYGDDDRQYGELACKVAESFNKKFWNEELNCLYDVVDENDDKIRPNQIWAVSLPFTMLDADKEKKVVNTVYEHLYTPYGLRSLSYRDDEYKAQYIGKLHDRDAAYHMGTTWAFPSGGFITAYLKVNNYSKEAVEDADNMCKAFFDHMNDGCLGGIAEVFDGTTPCTGNGCYSQAWSVGEILRAYVEDVALHLQEAEKC